MKENVRPDCCDTVSQTVQMHSRPKWRLYKISNNPICLLDNIRRNNLHLFCFWENIGQEYPSIILPYRDNAMINIMVYPDPVYTSAAATAPPPPSPPPEVIIMVSDDSDVDDEEYSSMSIAKGGVACPFPWKLHQMLDMVEREGLQSIVSWQPHGKSFLVHRPADFTSLILPRYVTYGRTVLDFFVCFHDIPSNSRRFSFVFFFQFLYPNQVCVLSTSTQYVWVSSFLSWER
jgi:hypothetical protein